MLDGPVFAEAMSIGEFVRLASGVGYHDDAVILFEFENQVFDLFCDLRVE